MGTGSPHITILGGGPAGLSVAFYAHREGLPFRLFEGSAQLGGLCRTLTCGPHRYDTGAHRFHDRLPDITRDVRDLLGDRLATVDAPSKVLMEGRFFDFPPTPLNALFSAGLRKIGKMGNDFVRARFRPRPTRSFADFAVNAFGESLARRFLLNYSEKVWGLAADELSPDIATRRLSGMTLGTLFAELILPARKSTHIDGRFLYPLGGYGEICAALVEQLPRSDIQVRHLVTGIDCEGDRLQRIHFKDQPSFEPPDTVVSSLPLNVLVSCLGERLPAQTHAACQALRYRDVRLIFLRLAQERVTENASVYLPDPSLCVARVYEPRNRSETMAPTGETALVAEIPCFEDEAIAQLTDGVLFERVVRELTEIGLIRRPTVIQWRHHLLPNAYPVYSLDYLPRVQTVMRALGPIANLHTLGRNGLFFYSHLHDQLQFGKQLVERIVRKKTEVPKKAVQ